MNELTTLNVTGHAFRRAGATSPPHVGPITRRLMSLLSTVAMAILALPGNAAPTLSSESSPTMKTNPAVAMFGSGCFWCSEAVFQRIPGVISAKSGYSGGTTKNPTYKQVCAGDTGHAEVVQVTYEPEKISYDKLLEMFWLSHDPTTLNQQGADVGTQYRSVIFFYDEEQKAVAVNSKATLDRSGKYKSPIVTQIVPAGEFYPAEADHVDYYNRNQSAPYCRFVIAPKLEKIKKAQTLNEKTQ